MALTQQEKQDIANLFLHLQGMPANLHSDDHKWIKQARSIEMERAAELKELKRRILRSACIWAIPFIIGFIFTAIYHESISFIAKTIISQANK